MRTILDMSVPLAARLGLLALLTPWAMADGDGLYETYCSNQNTGSDYNAVTSIYQSNGACFDQCQQNYAFAIVQYENCWCSNYIPSNQQSVHLCNQNCPGYPDDKCGNLTAGLYGYIKLPNVKPSGTAGASSSEPASSTSVSASSPSPSSSTQPTPTSSPTSTSQQQSETSYATQSSSPGSSSISSNPPSTTTLTTSSVTPFTTSASPSTTPSPVVSIQIVTVSGGEVTQTVTSTPFVAPNPNSESLHLQRHTLSGGAIAGIILGCLLALLLLLLLGAFLFWRRRNRNDDTEDAALAGGNGRRGGKTPRRNVSVLSKTGLLSRGGNIRPTSVTEKDFDEPVYPTGNSSVRHSMLFASGGAMAPDGVSPASPLGSNQSGPQMQVLERRGSRPLVYDQRLNPSALFMLSGENGSRVSIQDQKDYSRPLGVVNPDVNRPSFESRVSR